MSFIDQLSDPLVWERFYEYKSTRVSSGALLKDLRAYIDARDYLPVCESIARGEPFPLPRKSIISKMGSDKKRVVYTYPPRENMLLKLLTYLLLRRYDGLFSAQLYSFRPRLTAKDAVKTLKKTRGLNDLYAYKVDIHDYFNSIPLPLFLPELRAALDDEELYDFLSQLLLEKRVKSGKEIIEEEKGIMAGTPLSAFYANLYLRALDAHFEEQGVLYARYSDDIIVFARDREEIDAHAAYIKEYLAARRLCVNPAKENLYLPREGFTFLGFAVNGKTVDIAPATLKKLKMKMRRKARALMRWQQRGGHGNEKAAKAFVRIFRRKLLEGPTDRELSWSAWFFPVITTTKSLHEIDLYAQECLRWLLGGTRTKARFNVRYEDLKAIGYESLVHAYYSYEREQD